VVSSEVEIEYPEDILATSIDLFKEPEETQGVEDYFEDAL
jgi:hypothetical protein